MFKECGGGGGLSCFKKQKNKKHKMTFYGFFLPSILVDRDETN